MSVTYGSSRTGASRSPSTSLAPFQPQVFNGLPATTPWTRPADWAAMPTIVAGDRKIAILYAVWDHGSNLVALSVSGSAGYTVDWGDGSPTVNVASGVQTNYNYSYSTVPGAVTTRGYKTAVAVITAQSGGTLTAINTNLRNPLNTNTGTGTSAAASPMLEIVVGSANLTSWTMGSGTPIVRHSYCESVQVVEIGTLTSCASLFNTFSALQKVSLFNTASVTDMSSMFQNCSSLETVPAFNTAACTTMNNMFQNCSRLISVPDFNTSLVTGMGSMFQECRSLTVAPNFNTSSVTNFGNMYRDCSSLYWVPPIRATAAGLTTMTFMFASCGSLRGVTILQGTQAAGAITAQSMFQSCISLVNPPSLNYRLFNSVRDMYTGCVGIVRFPNRVFDFAGIGAIASGQNMFSGCTGLKSIDTIINANAWGSGAFFNCSALISVGSIPGPVTLVNMFNGCLSLRSVPTLVNASLSPTGVFYNCQSLDTVTVDFTTQNVSTMSSWFNGCVKLRSVNFINLTFAGTSVQLSETFQSCRSLVTAPTLPLGTAGRNFSLMFNDCRSLQTVPAYNVTTATDLSSMFQGCTALKSVELTANTTGVNCNFSSMFSGCTSLEYIGAINMNNASSGGFTTPITGTPNLSRVTATGMKFTFSVASGKLAGAQLNEIYTNLATVTAQTITVTNNWGTATDTPTIATAKGWTVTGS